MPYVQRVTIENFRSIRRADISFQGLDVLIGLNGSGKSNMLSFFSMLGHVRTGSLQRFVQVRSGGASSLLYRGPSHSTSMSWRVEFDLTPRRIAYMATLDYSVDDSLVFRSESAEARQPGQAVLSEARLQAEAISRESRMNDPTVVTEPNVRAVWTSLRDTRYFQFHNTSYTARIRQRRETESASQLWDDAGNLAAFLVRLRDESPESYRSIVYSCRKVIPWFDDFAWPDNPLESGHLRLAIRERSGEVFQAHQISDGTLRFFALTTLLSQPVNLSPSFICIDEPELGLFPAALSELADLMRSRHQDGVQILLATQSREFLRYLDVAPIVAERKPTSWSETVFRRLSPADLNTWYDEYTQGDENERR